MDNRLRPRLHAHSLPNARGVAAAAAAPLPHLYLARGEDGVEHRRRRAARCGDRMTVEGAPRVLAAIVNYNRADLTLDTVASILRLAGEAPMTVLVVDSASAAADLDKLRAGLPAQVGLEALSVNAGYGAACNAAIRKAGAEDVPYVWLLNNDIAFEPGCLRELVRVMDQGPDLAACAPVVVEFERPDIILSSGMKVGLRFGRISHVRYGLPVATLPTGVERVDALEASALLIRTRAAVECGGFDEGFFMYSEDLDWSLRVRERGWKLACAPKAAILHHVSQSSAPLDRIEYMIRNRIRSVRIHGTAANQATFMANMVLGWLPAYAVARLLFRFGPVASARAVIRPVLWNLGDARRRHRWRLRSTDQQIGPRAS
jgi:GT2 family glycosyltransferase